MLPVIFTALFAALIGLAFCFYGYRIFLVLLPVWGFFAGFWLGAETVSLILGSGFLGTTIGWAAGIILGFLIAVLSYLVFSIGIFLIAAGFGAVLGTSLMSSLGFDSGLLIGLVGVLGGLITGGLTLFVSVEKYTVIAITALGGANAILMSLLLLLGRIPLEAIRSEGNPIEPLIQDSWFWLIIWLAIAIVGIVVQYNNSRDYEFTQEIYIEGWG